MRFLKVATLLVATTFAVAPATAGAADHATTALNIIPSGQLETGQNTAPYPNGAFDFQAKMYDGLTPLYRNVTDGDLAVDKYFKAETLPSTLENEPGAFVTTETPKRSARSVTRANPDDSTSSAIRSCRRPNPCPAPPPPPPASPRHR